MLKLFAVSLGGRADGCNTELHDVVFVIGESIEETYPKLIEKWFGNKKRLHIDSVIELKFIDGHEICVSANKVDTHKKLFFVNFGAYKENYFGEIHEVGFYVGSSKTDVLSRAKQDLCLSLIEPHCDDNLSVDDVILLDCVDQHYLHLVETNVSSQITIKSEYYSLTA
jgi:hypothetical protein